ncbi:MAG TPA: PHP domain-containing protein [Bacteroidales bacterium]|nr:PHP domain-containing protein [Bacteroidales bacterium]
MKTRFLIPAILILTSLNMAGQKKVLNMPDIPGYVTLKCDFHMHTVFSDGNVWPTVRIEEAVRDGLDAIAITDHLEYQPKKKYITPSYNAAWEIAQSLAAERNLILVHGAEITRSMPPGHINALFIEDANPINNPDFMLAVEAAVSQGAFIMYNHPGWRSQEKDGIPKFYPVHKELIAKGWLHGIEYFNEFEHYPLVLDMCRDNKLAVMGNSDVHGVISEIYTAPDYTQRPMTLVFAKERTPESLREAMFAGRTAVWYGNFLAGFEEYTAPLFKAAVTLSAPFKNDGKNLWFEMQNHSDLKMELTDGPEGAPSKLTLLANSKVIVKADIRYLREPMKYNVSNIITGNGTVLSVLMSIPAGN